MPGVLERPEEAHADRVDSLREQPLDRRLGFGFVQGDHDLAEAVDALRDALDQALRDNRHGLRTLGKVHDLPDVARGDAARAAHDVDGVLVPARGDQPHLRAFSLDEGVRADSGPVREHLDIAAEFFEGKPEPVRRHAHRGEHAFRKIARRRRRLGRSDVALVVEHHAVGEGPANIHADQKPSHFSPPAVLRAGW